MKTAFKAMAAAGLFWGAVAFGNAAAATRAAPATAPASSSTAKAGSSGDLPADAKAAIARIDAAARRVRPLYDQASRAGQNDPVKAQCLHDKLSQLQALLKTAMTRSNALTSALARGSSDTVNHHISALQTLKRRAEQLDLEANGCMGAATTGEGDTKLNVAIDPNMADPNFGDAVGPGFSGGGDTTVDTGSMPSIPPVTQSAVR